MLFLIAMAQAAPSAAPQRIDLTISHPCGTPASADDDVIVCGRRRGSSNRYRIPPPTPYQEELPKAELVLGNGTSLNAETERVDIGGSPSNRVMMRLKLKF